MKSPKAVQHESPPESEIRHDVTVSGWRVVEADAAQFSKLHFLGVLVLQNVPVASKLQSQNDAIFPRKVQS